MGSGASKGKRYQDTHQYGELYLQTDKTTYQPGDTVTGTIHLDLTSEYPGHQLFLKLKGREVVHILKEIPGRFSPTFVIHSEAKDIIKQNTLVYSWETSTPLGQFSIPFSFLLPNYLPASFYQYGHYFLAFIEYQLETFLQPPMNTDFPKMKYKQPITIRETPLTTNNQHLEVTTSLESCSCLNQGSNILKATLDKNFYLHGENINITIELDNSNSKLGNKQFLFSFDQKLEIKAKNETLTIESPKSLIKLPGVVKAKTIGSHSDFLPLSPFISEFDYKTEFDKYNPQTRDLFIWTDGYGFTTPTKSSLISSTFSLKISCLMDGHHPTVPKIEFPISILAPDAQPPVLATAPQNWRPLVLDRINVAFSSEHQNQNVGGNMMQIQAMPGNVAYPNQVILETPKNHN